MRRTLTHTKNIVDLKKKYCDILFLQKSVNERIAIIKNDILTIYN